MRCCIRMLAIRLLEKAGPSCVPLYSQDQVECRTGRCQQQCIVASLSRHAICDAAVGCGFGSRMRRRQGLLLNPARLDEGRG